MEHTPVLLVVKRRNRVRTAWTATQREGYRHSPELDLFHSLNLSSGLAIGGAFTLSDATNDVVIVAVRSVAATFNIAYQVGSSASVCAGDYGTGTLTIQ